MGNSLLNKDFVERFFWKEVEKKKKKKPDVDL